MSTYIPPTEDEFVQALRGHFRWAPSAGPSCFLSILNNERHGLAWGRQRYWDANCEEVRVYEIDLTQLEGHVVLRVNDLRERYGLELDWDTSDEYLVLNRIPARALVRETNIGDLIDREEEARADRLDRERRRRDPRYHWVPELWGYYDTDEECEESNLNDDLMKGLEG